MSKITCAKSLCLFINNAQLAEKELLCTSSTMTVNAFECFFYQQMCLPLVITCMLLLYYYDAFAKED